MNFGPRLARSCSVVAGVASLTIAFAAWADPQGPGTSPPKKIYQCAGQLTRPADHIITMTAGQAFYKYTDSAAPVSTLPVSDSGAMTAAEAKLKACNRRVIEIRVPSTATSGCDGCYKNAEIHACAGSFPGSKAFEEHCRVPTSSTAEAVCKTFSHPVQVYKKASGAATFALTPLKSFLYKGFKDSTGCRVAAKNMGQIHDTAEVYANVLPPGSGTDVYRVLSLPKYSGELVDTVIFIEYEKSQ